MPGDYVAGGVSQDLSHAGEVAEKFKTIARKQSACESAREWPQALAIFGAIKITSQVCS